MTPVNLDGRFCWLHLPSSGFKSTGIVVCPGLKTDELTAYTALVQLSDALAAQGFPTLRLHYSNTGDSADTATIDHWDQWQADVHQAADWLKKTFLVDHVAFVGLRFGALIAAVVASQRLDVTALALLSPVLRGRTYMRQIRSDGYFALGARLSERDIATIGNIDLKLCVPAAACKVLLATQSAQSLSISDCVDMWRTNGIDVTVTESSELGALLRPTFVNHEPIADTTFVVRWISNVCPNTTRQIASLFLPDVVVQGNQWSETPVFFGSDNSLFGILCKPLHDNKTVVIIGNSSADPHCAPNLVGLARHLAAQGVPSLRIDFSGVGDSVGSDPTGTHVFEVDRSADFSAAIDRLQSLGYEKFAVQGLCSGAFHAYHTAMTDQRINYALLINLPFFEWLKGFDVADLVFHARKPGQFMREIRTQLFWIALWQRICQGDFRVITNRFVGLKRRLGWVPGFGKKPQGRFARQVAMLFIVSEGDISGEAIKRQFGPKLPAGSEMDLMEGLDHTMQRAGMCRVVAYRMATFLHNKAVLPVSNLANAGKTSHSTAILAQG
jgi:alpha/beta superfamily hydrolase